MENKNQIDVFTLVVIATLGVLVLILFLVFIVALYQKRILAHKALLIDTENKHQRKLLNASLEIAEQERVKVATNIHDDIGITLNVLKINLNRARKNITNQKLFEEMITASFKNIDDSLDAVRTIYNDILPPSLMNLGFVKGIKELCNQINHTDTIKIEFSSQTEDVVLNKKTEVQLYRLTKEVLNNTIKHAKPTIMQIAINSHSNYLEVCLLHNGIGITTEMIRKFAETSTGLGLKSILTRSQLIDAALEFKILENKMAKVIIKTPL